LLPEGRVEKSKQKEVKAMSLYEVIYLILRLLATILAYLAFIYAKKKD